MKRGKKTIASMREKSGLTQVELASLMEVSENTIANWEKGNAASKWIHNLNKLCKVLGCTLEDLDNSETQTKDEIEPDLTIDIIETIQSYCKAISNNQKKVAASIASFATLHNSRHKFWLNQAESIINQWQEKHGEQIDCDFIINSLILQNISFELSRSSFNHITFEKFCNIVKQAKFSDSFLNKYIKYSETKFLRKIIFQTKYLCIYSISWTPGQLSKMHHHGNSLDAIWVVKGNIDHWLISTEEGEKENYPHEYNHDKVGKRYEKKPATVISSDDWIFIDRRMYHQIGNLSEGNAVTVHFRFGSPPADDKWETKMIEAQPEITWKLTENYQVMSV